MNQLNPRQPVAWIACLALLALGGCASTTNHAPVEVRAPSNRPTVVKAEPPPAVSTDVSPTTAEAKPGTYVVKASDTLMRIALETGQAWRDIARWNGIENPNLIEVGQVLRVVPPAAGDPVVVAKPVTATKVETKPLDPKLAVPAASAPVATPTPPAVVQPPAPSAAASAKEGDDDVQWAWPAGGQVVTSFDDKGSKGLAIGGKAGDPVYAAADGRVVYAGSGLRGYGNLVIVKHNATYLTAYAHNQTLLVKEDQAVRKGQKIAEMGSSDAERVQLHFEIRRQGKPIDPGKLLPAR